MDSATTIAASGMNAAIARFGAAASRLVNNQAEGSNPDLPTQVVDLIEARAGFAASLTAFKATDRMMGSLFELLV